jgi:ribosome maturation factor RimP
MASKQELLHDMIAPIVASLGCELWGLEYLTQGRYTTLRIFIDAPAGVSLEDCEKVSRQISSVMDVEDPIDGEYTLEVSSPGMDRPLYTPTHYARYVGETVNLRLRMPRDGRRRFKGEIVKVEGEDVAVNVEGKEILLPVDAIDKANIVPRYDEIISKIDGLKEKSKSEEK